MNKTYFEMSNIEIREKTDTKNKILTGYAIEWDKLSVPIYDFREKISRGAFSESIKHDEIKALWSHNTEKVLGSTHNGTLLLTEDDRGLRFEIEPPDTSYGNDSIVSVKRGDVKGVSFGFEKISDEWDESNKKSIVRTIIKARLYEISPTAFPAYPQTSVKAEERNVLKDYEDYKKTKAITRQGQDLNIMNLKLTILEKECIL